MYVVNSSRVLAGHVDFAEPRLVSVAAAHNVSAAQVALRWIAQQDIPFAVSPGLNEQYAVSLTPAQQRKAIRLKLDSFVEKEALGDNFGTYWCRVFAGGGYGARLVCADAVGDGNDLLDLRTVVLFVCDEGEVERIVKGSTGGTGSDG